MPSTSKVLHKHSFHSISSTTVVEESLSESEKDYCPYQHTQIAFVKITIYLLLVLNLPDCSLLETVFTWPHTPILPICPQFPGWSFPILLGPFHLPTPEILVYQGLSSVLSSSLATLTPWGISSSSMASYLISTLAAPNSHPINSSPRLLPQTPESYIQLSDTLTWLSEYSTTQSSRSMNYLLPFHTGAFPSLGILSLQTLSCLLFPPKGSEPSARREDFQAFQKRRATLLLRFYLF